MQQRTLPPPTTPTSPSSPNLPTSPSSVVAATDEQRATKHATLPPLITSMPPPSSMRRISVMQLCTPTPVTSVEMNYLMRRRNSIITPQSAHYSSDSFETSRGSTAPTTPDSSCVLKSGVDVVAESPILRRVVALPVRGIDRSPNIGRQRIGSRRSSEARSLTSTKQHRARSPIRKRSRSPPPKYHLTVLPSTAQPLPFHTPSTNTAYATTLAHLDTPLVPLVSVTSGLPHPQFPSSILQYHLLTHEQLDSLSRWYHQTDPSTEETWKYPAKIPGWTNYVQYAQAFQQARSTGEWRDMTGVDLETKRRRWGRFIGLRGCESPTVTSLMVESLMDRMEREWREALRRQMEQERLREKLWRGYF